MNKTILGSVALLFFANVAGFVPQDRQNIGSLRKYLRPAEITMLDWKLMQVQVASFTTTTGFDESGLVYSVSLFARNDFPDEPIGIVFLVKKQTYLNLENHVVEKTFLDVIDRVGRIIQYTLPELKGRNGIWANFVAVDRDDRLGLFSKGKLELFK